MAAALTFWSNGYRIETGANSGLGFYGANFGTSVLVGAWSARCFHTDSAGTTQGPEGLSCQWISSTGVVLGAGGGSGIALTQVPNAQATINARFENDTPVQVTSATLYAYDRSSINNSPSGLAVRAFEAIHPHASQSPAQLGSGDSTWTTLAGSGSTLSLAPSPGSGGLYAGNGSNSTRQDMCHDHYVGVSVSPSTVGSKLAALYLAIEYL